MSDSMCAVADSLAGVVGANCKRIRSRLGLTQDQLAGYARALGLRWTTSSVGDFESGRSAPTFATILTAGIALQWASMQRRTPEDAPITLADLLDSDGLIALTDAIAVKAADLAEVCRGEELLLDWYQTVGDRYVKSVPTEMLREATTAQRAGITGKQRLAEQRLARQLGIEAVKLGAVAFQLWGKTYSEERDRRAGSDANQQKKGRISRELRAELEEALGHGDR